MDGNRLQVVSEDKRSWSAMSEEVGKQSVAAVKNGNNNKILGLIKRNFTDRSEETIMLLQKFG